MFALADNDQLFDDPQILAALREDLRTLDLDAATMQQHVDAVRALRANVEDLSDPEAEARERHHELRLRLQEIEDRIAEAKVQIAAAEQERSQIRWSALNRADAIKAARLAKRLRATEAAELREQLQAAGCPASMIPTGESRDDGILKEPDIPHRVLRPSFIDNVLHEPGAVVLQRERIDNGALRPLAEGESVEPPTPEWKVKALRNHRGPDNRMRMKDDIKEETKLGQLDSPSDQLAEKFYPTHRSPSDPPAPAVEADDTVEEDANTEDDESTDDAGDDAAAVQHDDTLLDRAKQLGLSDADAGKLTDTVAEARASWVEQVRSDELLNGGPGFDQNLQIARKAIKQLDPSGDLIEILNRAGLGSHPAMVKLALRAGKALGL